MSFDESGGAFFAIFRFEVERPRDQKTLNCYYFGQLANKRPYHRFFGPSAWVQRLRESSLPIGLEPDVSMHEAEYGRILTKTGKAAGIDGIPSDAIRNLSVLTPVMCALFSLMLRMCIYPTSWGMALVRAIVKPGKTKHDVNNLRGIRL